MDTIALESFPVSKGAWEACTHQVDGVDVIGVNLLSDKGKVIAITGKQGDRDEETSIGDAFLIAEAGTVFNECGIRPREMLRRLQAAQARLRELDPASQPQVTP